MLIFNCSRAFANFMAPKPGSGLESLIVMPPAEAAINDNRWLQSQYDQPLPAVWQWQVHMVYEQDEPCVLVMEADTRYCMLFTEQTPGDMQGLLKQILERLLNVQFYAARGLGIVSDADCDAIMHSLLTQHRDARLVLRSDRSVQCHLNEVAYHLGRQVEKRGGLPHGHDQCAMFDEHSNSMPRRSKNRPDWFFAEEEMLCYCMSQFAGWTAAQIVGLREQIKHKQRQIWNLRDEVLEPGEAT